NVSVDFLLTLYVVLTLPSLILPEDRAQRFIDRRRGLHRGTWERSGGKMTRSFFAALICAIAIVLSGAPLSAQNAYITNFHGNTVSVIATATNTVVGLPIPVGTLPLGVAVTPDGSMVYVASFGDGSVNGTVSVIATATN